MGVYMSKPVTEKESLDLEGKLVKCGASSMQGWRVSQEVWRYFTTFSNIILFRLTFVNLVIKLR